MSFPLKMIEAYTSLLAGICGPTSLRPSVPNDRTVFGNGDGGKVSHRTGKASTQEDAQSAKSGDRDKGVEFPRSAIVKPPGTLSQSQRAVRGVEAVHDTLIPDIRLGNQAEFLADVGVHGGSC